MKLSEINFNQNVTVTKIKVEKSLKTRLLSLGVSEGVVIKKTHTSLLNTAIIIEVNQTRIAIRKEVAESIYVN